MHAARPAPLREDPWLGGLLRRPAWRVEPTAETEAVASALDVLAGPSFCDARIPGDRTDRLAALQEAGMRVVCTALTLVRRPGPPPDPDAHDRCEVRVADPERDAGMVDVARRCFRHSRFHLDPRLPGGVADEIKAEWAANCLAGNRGDETYVSAEGGEVSGFLAVMRTPDARVIDLIGVDPDAQGQGAGSALVRHLIDTDPSATIRVGTQAANVGATRFYEGLGFELEASAFDLHIHRDA